MLVLMCDVGGIRCAVDCVNVVEVIPQVKLDPLPGRDRRIAGIACYRGHFIPVIDMVSVWTENSCSHRWSSRIIILETGETDKNRQFGLLVKNAEPVSCLLGPVDASENMGLNPLGKFCQDENGIYNLLNIKSIIDQILDPHTVLPQGFP